MAFRRRFSKECCFRRSPRLRRRRWRALYSCISCSLQGMATLRLRCPAWSRSQTLRVPHRALRHRSAAPPHSLGHIEQLVQVHSSVGELTESSLLLLLHFCLLPKGVEETRPSEPRHRREGLAPSSAGDPAAPSSPQAPTPPSRRDRPPASFHPPAGKRPRRPRPQRSPEPRATAPAADGARLEPPPPPARTHHLGLLCAERGSGSGRSRENAGGRKCTKPGPAQRFRPYCP